MYKPESCINTGFWFIQGSGLYRILVKTGFWFIQGSGLYRVLVYTTRILYKPEPCINQNPV
jgi:hypothetical protein